MKKIQQIESKATFVVRHPVLRNGKPVETCCFEGDDLSTTTHFGLFFDEKIVGVVSVFESVNSIFEAEQQIQIRGMAILPEFQKKGFGTDLMKHCETYYSGKNEVLIWFNARDNAVPFYEKLGYSKVGAAFDIPEIGIHYIMKKELTSAYE
ncbi:MAG: GNAT family N-acetyltransferase [Flavobacterium sp.]